MREILFRGKLCNNGEWVQGFYVRADHHWHKRGIHKDWIIEGASANGGWFSLHNKYPVKAESIGQYTGLTDKNGKKIFEGDILRITERGCTVDGGIVVFQNGYPGGWLITDKKHESECSLAMRNCVEVTGNIHDNPKLLEVE